MNTQAQTVRLEDAFTTYQQRLAEFHAYTLTRGSKWQEDIAAAKLAKRLDVAHRAYIELATAHHCRLAEKDPDAVVISGAGYESRPNICETYTDLAVWCEETGIERSYGQYHQVHSMLVSAPSQIAAE